MWASAHRLVRTSGAFFAGVASATAIFAISPALSALRGPLVASAADANLLQASSGNSAGSRAAHLAITPSASPLATGLVAVDRNRELPFVSGSAGLAPAFNLPEPVSRSGEVALRCLTQAVYYEAGFEPVAGRRAVAQVVLNRMRHKAFPKSVCGVVYQGSSRPGCQFSFTCDGSLRRAPSPAAWREAQAVAQSALDGYVEPRVGLATHYHANYVMPYWAPKLAKLTQIGAHIFYRWRGGWGRPAAYAGQYLGVESIPRVVASPRLAVTPSEAFAPAAFDHPSGAREMPLRMAGPGQDVGGRLDVQTGWKLQIAPPTETRSRAADVIRRQSGVASLLEEAAEGAP